jgi:hypothetical protein
MVGPRLSSGRRRGGRSVASGGGGDDNVNYRYVRQGAAGAGTGLSWTDAYTTLPATLTRGLTYYIADGSYASYFFDDAQSGTTLITIKKATVSDHGTNTGWVSTYGDGQAVFTAPLKFRFGYYVLNGATRNESDWSSHAAYGFKVVSPTGQGNELDYGPSIKVGGLLADGSRDISLVGLNANNVQILYTAVMANQIPNVAVRSYQMDTDTESATAGFVASRCYIEKGNNHYFVRGTTGAIVEYCYSHSAKSTVDNHGEVVNLYYNAHGAIVRHNIIRDNFDPGFVPDVNGYAWGTAAISIVQSANVEIYGNVFYNNCHGDAVVGFDSTNTANAVPNIKLYNNTVHTRSGVNGFILPSGSSGSGLNNMFIGAGSWANISHSFNATTAASMAGDASVQLNVSPSIFVSEATGDFRLVSGTTHGSPLSAPYNTDLLGATRGADGTWDRGAHEYSVGGGFSNNLRAVVNFSGVNDYSSLQPYINLIKGSDRQWDNSIPWNDSRLDANGEPGNLGAGQTISRLQWISHEKMSHQVIRPGTYVLKWSGAGNFQPNGIASTLTGPGRRTFTLTSANVSLSLDASNGPVTNLRLCHSDHEAALDAGVEILNPDFVAWLLSWPTVKAWRFLDFLSTNLSAVVNASDWTPLSYISWCRGTYGCPPEVVAEIARKTNNSPVWTTMPYLATDACMVALFQRMKNWYDGTYTVLAEGINEAWNYGFPGTTWLQETYGYTIQNRDSAGNAVANTDVQRRINSAYGHHTLRVWAAADSVFGTSRVRYMAGGQTGFPQFMYWWSNYFDPALMGGQRIKDLMNARGHIIMTHYFSLPSPSTGLPNFKTQSLDDWGNKTDLEWMNLWKAHIDAHSTPPTGFWPTTKSLHAGLGNNAGLMIYEGGCHDFIDAHNPPWRSFAGTVNTGDNTVTMSAADYAGFTQFDNVSATNQTLGGGLDAYDQWAICRKLSGNRLRLYPTLSAATADSGDVGTGAGMMNAGTFEFQNITRHVAMQNKLFSLLQGAAGLEIIQYITAALQSSGLNVRNNALFAGPTMMRRGRTERFTYCFESPNKGVYNIGTETPYVQYLKDTNIP